MSKTPPRNIEPLPDVEEKIRRSSIEVEGMAVRDVRCPHCKFVIARVYADTQGHIHARCRKCKHEQPLNLAYFRKQRGVWRLKEKYYGKRYFEKLNKDN